MKKFSLKKLTVLAVICVGIMGLQINTYAKLHSTVTAVKSYVYSNEDESSDTPVATVTMEDHAEDALAQLPKYAVISYIEGFSSSTTTAEINWELGNYDPAHYAATHTEITGTLKLNDGFLNPLNIKVKATIKTQARIKEHPAASRQSWFLKNNVFLYDNYIHVNSSTNLDDALPEKACLYTSYKDQNSCPGFKVDWDTSEVDLTTPGCYYLHPTHVYLTDLYYNPDNVVPYPLAVIVDKE